MSRFSSERRKRSRLNLHWPVSLWSLKFGSLQLTTENLSSEGFYCLTHHDFRIGDMVDCQINLSGLRDPRPSDPVLLRCRAQVVRVELLEGDSGLGVGFQIEEYSVAVDDVSRLWDERIVEPGVAGASASQNGAPALLAAAAPKNGSLAH